ncbi:MAG: peptidase, partial [Gammaproteobacteria bacterium]|nr:peptidase [Gammaproteobacteria bacterium]
GTPLAALEEALVPIYLLHRYQVEAAVKLLGGVHYTYAVRGDGQPRSAPVDPERQADALEALLEAMAPRTLTLPERILRLIPPRAYGMDRHRETFDIRTAVTLDPVTIAEAAADHVVELMLHPARATRLVEQHARAAD